MGGRRLEGTEIRCPGFANAFILAGRYVGTVYYTADFKGSRNSRCRVPLTGGVQRRRVAGGVHGYPPWDKYHDYVFERWSDKGKRFGLGLDSLRLNWYFNFLQKSRFTVGFRALDGRLKNDRLLVNRTH